MPDQRQHRGPHPEDQQLFSTDHWHSGRLKRTLRELAEEHNWRWEIELVPDPDFVLAQTENTVASADSQILDTANHWFNLAKHTINDRVADKWIVDLSGSLAAESVGYAAREPTSSLIRHASRVPHE